LGNQLVPVTFLFSAYNKQASCGGLAGRPKGGKAMTVIPLSPFEIIQVILYVILIYVTWETKSKKKETKK